MNPIPGSSQIYTGGNNGVNSPAECHSPNSIFSYDEKGNIIEGLNECNESKSISIISGLTEYIMHSDCEDKEQLIQFLTYLAGRVATDGEFINKVLTGEEQLDMEQLTTLVAYLLSYCNEKDISSADIYTLLIELHVSKEDDKWLGKDPLLILSLIFAYVKSNEDDQEYTFLEIVDIFAYFVNGYAKTQDDFWKSSIVGYFVNKKIGDKSDIIDNGTKIIANILSRIKRKYKSIHYDSSRKVVLRTIKLKKITPLDNFREKVAPKVFYDLSEIQRALQKMEEAKEAYVQFESITETELSGKSVKAYLNLYQNYNALNQKLYEMIEKTYEQIKNIYNAVSVL